MNKWLFHQNGFTRTSLSATVTRVSNFVEENVCVCGVFTQELDVYIFSILVYHLRSRVKDGHSAAAQIVSG